MTKFLSLFALSLCLCVLTGCEWTAGSGTTSWDDSQNFVDFSGSYKASDGGVLVRQFGATNTITTNTTYSTNTVSSEYLATGDGVLTAFSGQLGQSPVRGSLTIFTVGGYRFTDSAFVMGDTVSLEVTPADGSTGTFNYSTRAWALTFPAPIANGTQILGTYQYVSSSQVINPVQGNHGNAIYSFVVYQTGNKIQLVDSNGARYDGTIGTMRTTNGKQIDLSDPTTILPSTGTVVAQFSATGTSQGYKVTIVGVLQGNLVTSTSMTGRSLKATFIEEAGNEADINAVAGL